MHFHTCIGVHFPFLWSLPVYFASCLLDIDRGAVLWNYHNLYKLFQFAFAKFIPHYTYYHMWNVHVKLPLFILQFYVMFQVIGNDIKHKNWHTSSLHYDTCTCNHCYHCVTVLWDVIMGLTYGWNSKEVECYMCSSDSIPLSRGLLICKVEPLLLYVYVFSMCKK